jgi:hypothetical protein
MNLPEGKGQPVHKADNFSCLAKISAIQNQQNVMKIQSNKEYKL